MPDWMKKLATMLAGIAVVVALMAFALSAWKAYGQTSCAPSNLDNHGVNPLGPACHEEKAHLLREHQRVEMDWHYRRF